MKLVITRHKALIMYLLEKGVIEPNKFEVYAQADEALVAGQDVIGVLPIYLASKANSLTVVQLNTPLEKRGCELSLEEVREYAGELKTYKVQEL